MIRVRALLTALTSLSSLTSFASYTLLLRFLGTSAQVDSFFYAASVPTAIAGITGGVLIYLLPVQLTKLSPTKQACSIWLAISAVSLLSGVAATALVIIYIYQVRLFWILCGGFTLLAGISLGSTLLTCLAQARGAYMHTGIAAFLSSLGLLIGVLAAAATRWVWMVLICQLAATSATLLWQRHALQVTLPRRLRRTWLIGIDALRPLRSSALTVFMGTAAFTLFQPIDAALCANLDRGALTVMAFSQRVLVAVGTVVSLGAYVIAARTSFETLKTGGRNALVRQSNLEATRLVITGLIAWLVYVLFGKYVLETLLNSSTMSGSDLTRLLSCLGWILLGAGPMAAVPYLFRVLYSMNQYRIPALLGIIIPSGYWLIGSQLSIRHDVFGLAAAYIIVWWAAMLFCVGSINRLGRTNDGHGDQAAFT